MNGFDIRRCGADDIKGIVRIFGEASAFDNSFLYSPITDDDAIRLFFAPAENLTKMVFAAYNADKMVGFSAGCRINDGGKSYLAMAAVDPDYRRRGIGGALTDTLDKALGADIFEVSFYDPIQLEWRIPGTGNNAVHNNAPGADMSSSACAFLESLGFGTWSVQYSYYLPLDGYIESDKIAVLKRSLAEKGIYTGFYSPDIHDGFDDMCDDVGFPGWKATVARELVSPSPRPILCAFNGGRVIGSVGCISASPGGRGVFSGVGVRKEYRGIGVGTLMFNALCSRLRQLGAGYMTLFTGMDNAAARHIYESAGFIHVRSWALMKKSRI